MKKLTDAAKELLNEAEAAIRKSNDERIINLFLKSKEAAEGKYGEDVREQATEHILEILADYAKEKIEPQDVVNANISPVLLDLLTKKAKDILLFATLAEQFKTMQTHSRVFE